MRKSAWEGPDLSLRDLLIITAAISLFLQVGIGGIVVWLQMFAIAILIMMILALVCLLAVTAIEGIEYV